MWRALVPRAVGRRVLSQNRDADDLGDDGADLTRSCGNAVASRSISCRIAFSRNDKGRRVGAGVEEKLRNNVEGEHRAFAQVVKVETEDAEDDGEQKEAAELKGLTADAVDCEDGSPVARNGPGTCEYNHSNGLVVQFVVQCTSGGIANGTKDHGIVQA